MRAEKDRRLRKDYQGEEVIGRNRVKSEQDVQDLHRKLKFRVFVVM